MGNFGADVAGHHNRDADVRGVLAEIDEEGFGEALDSEFGGGVGGLWGAVGSNCQAAR